MNLLDKIVKLCRRFSWTPPCTFIWMRNVWQATGMPASLWLRTETLTPRRLTTIRSTVWFGPATTRSEIQNLILLNRVDKLQIEVTRHIFSDRPSSRPSSETTCLAVCPATSDAPFFESSFTKSNKGEVTREINWQIAPECTQHPPFQLPQRKISLYLPPVFPRPGSRVWMRFATNCASVTQCETLWKGKCWVFASSSCFSSPTKEWWTLFWR